MSDLSASAGASATASPPFDTASAAADHLGVRVDALLSALETLGVDAYNDLRAAVIQVQNALRAAGL